MRPWWWLLILVLLPAAEGSARDGGVDPVIGNKFLELRFQRKGDQVQAASLVHRIAGRTIQLTSDDFELTFESHPPLHAADFSVRDVARQTLPAGQRLTLHLTQRGGTATAAIIYELNDDSFFLHRHLEFTPNSRRLLRHVEVWKIGLEGRCTHQETGPPEEMLHNVWGIDRKMGFGKPVFLEDTFWGLEFPAGYNHYASGYLTLRHSPGRMISEIFTSKIAVLGVTPPGHVAAYFRDYITRERQRPVRPEVQVDYNTWTTVSPATESNSLELIQQFKKNLFEPYGMAFDSFTLDDGWDEKNSLWALRASGFPEGLNPLLEALRPMRTKLGLWLSPSSGYEHAAWGGKNGYTRNATFDWFLCQSDPKYRREMARIVPELIQKHDLGFFKMDGFCASCDTQLHSHHLDGDFAREANVDAFLELIRAMRAAKPGVYLDPTSGMWLSPWWLWFVDSVYADTYDGTAPALVPSPNGFDGATTIRDALLRRRIAANPGFDPGAIETLGVYLDPTLAIEPATFFDNWQDNAMAVAGRGNRLLSFYLNPTNFPNPSKDWAFLADLIQWVRNQAPTLARTEMILGDPYRGEAYGYAHFLGRHGILSLRNPFIQPQAVRIKLDESSGWLAREAGDGRFTASVVFPYHETLRPTLRHGDWLELILQPYQTVIVEIEDKRASSPTLAGVRLREVNRSARKMSWEVYGLPGTKVSVPVTGLPKLTKIQVDGQARGSFGTKPSVDLPISFRGEKKRCFAEGGTIRAEPSVRGPGQLVGKCSATIPPGTKASIYVLYLDPSPAEIEFSCHAIINGKAVPAAEIHQLEGSKNTLRPVRELPLKPWVFFRIPVPEGKNVIKLSLDSVRSGNQAIEVQAGWWLWTEQPLQKATLTMDFNEVLPPAAAKVFPFSAPSEVQRQVFPLQAMKSYSLREGMPRSPP